MSTSQESRNAARRIVESVLAEHDAAGTVPRPPARREAAQPSDDPGRVAARRIVAEVLAAHGAREAAASDDPGTPPPADDPGTTAVDDGGETVELASEQATVESAADGGETVELASEEATVESAAADTSAGEPQDTRDQPDAPPTDTIDLTTATLNEPAVDGRPPREDQDDPAGGAAPDDVGGYENDGPRSAARRDDPAAGRGEQSEAEAAAGPPPLPVAVLERARAAQADGDAQGADDVRVYDEPQIILEPVYGAKREVESEARPRRAGRWLIVTVLAAVALTVLLPMAVAALRDLVAL